MADATARSATGMVEVARLSAPTEARAPVGVAAGADGLAGAERGRGVLVYVGASLPQLSETFVSSEILALRGRGWRVAPVSVREPGRNLGDPVLERLADEAIHVYRGGAAGVAGRALREAFTRPGRSIGTLACVLRDAIADPRLSWRARGKVVFQALGGLGLAGDVRPMRPLLIHAHMAHVPTTVAMYAARQLGVPLSFTGHAADLFPDRTLLEPKLRRAAFVACISRWHREFYRSIEARAEMDYPVVRCGVALPEAARGQRAGGTLEIVAVGRLVPKKGFDVLIDAVAALRVQGRAVRARIVGGGPEQASLEQRIKSLGLVDHVQMLGAMSHGEALALVAEGDAFVLPCKVDDSGDRDGIPVALMEAMARRVCVVSGDLPAIRELIEDGRTGVLVPPGEAQPLAAALAGLMDEPDRRAALAEAGRAWIEREFSREVNIDRLEAAIARTIGATAGGSGAASLRGAPREGA